MNNDQDFLLEKRLKEEAPDLHRRVTDSVVVLHVQPKEPRFAALIDDLAGKIQQTLDYCRDVAERRSDLRIVQERVTVAGFETQTWRIGK